MNICMHVSELLELLANSKIKLKETVILQFPVFIVNNKRGSVMANVYRYFVFFFCFLLENE